jgi:hypothetical protein
MEHQCDPANSSQAQNGLRPDATTALRNADRLGLFVTSLPKWIAVAVIAWQAGISIEALSSRSALSSACIAVACSGARPRWRVPDSMPSSGA